MKAVLGRGAPVAPVLAGVLGITLQARAQNAASPGPPAPASSVSATPDAASPSSDSPVHVDVGAGTYVPLAIDAEANVELPYRILVRGAVGWMPSAYSDAIIDVLGDFGVFDSFEQTLVQATLQNSLVARLSAGWRPFPRLGLELLVGYTLLTLGGSVTGSDVVDAYLASRGSSDRSTPLTNRSVPLSATLQNLDATVDWRFLTWDDRIVLRASVGYIQCFASSTSVTATAARPIEQTALNKVNADLQGYLNPYFTTYVKAPLLGVTAAYRF
jgi:hypothetical protein